MGFRARFDAAATVNLVLACDPAVVETNSTEALDRYQRDGDSGGMTIPDEAVRVTVRPITPAAKREASRKAGRPSHRGRRVEARKDKDPKIKAARKELALHQAKALLLREELKAAEGEKAAQLRVDLTDTLDALDSAREVVEDVVADWADALSDDDAEALARWNYYLNDRMEALVAECLVEWRQGKDAKPDAVLSEQGGRAFLDSLKPDDRALVCAELWFHLHKISELGAEGKARFERALGSAPLDDSPAPPTGIATSANEGASSNSEAPAEAPSSEG